MNSKLDQRSSKAPSVADPVKTSKGTPRRHRPADGVLGLLRFAPKLYMEDFVRGTLFMNTLEYFANVEKSVPRRDPNEGASYITQAAGAVFSIKQRPEDPFMRVGQIIGPIRSFSPASRNVNVFCLYALRASVAKNLVDRRNYAFGDTYAVLKDGDEFLRRVRAAAERAGHFVTWHPVTYIDDRTHTGPLNAFTKSKNFAYQSELRIALIPGAGQATRLEVGDLSDIVETGPLDDLHNRMRVE